MSTSTSVRVLVPVRDSEHTDVACLPSCRPPAGDGPPHGPIGRRTRLSRVTRRDKSGSALQLVALTILSPSFLSSTVLLHQLLFNSSKCLPNAKQHLPLPIYLEPGHDLLL